MGIKSKIAKILCTIGTALAIYKLADYVWMVFNTYLAYLTIAVLIGAILSVLGIVGLLFLWFILMSL